MPPANLNHPKPQSRHPLLAIPALAFAAFLILAFLANSWALLPTQYAVARGVEGAASVTLSATPTPPCSPTWSLVNSPNPSASSNNLSGIDARSPDDIWAVGGYNPGGGSRTLSMHWDGSQWTVVSSPSPGTTSNGFADVEIISSNDVWAVGYSHDYAGAWLTLIEHWNGVQWSIVPSPNPDPTEDYLTAVSSVSSSDVWAVGYYVTTVGGQGFGRTLIEHWDGVQWTVIPSSNIGSNNNYLSDVTAISSNDVWVVGRYWNTSVSSFRAIVEHWDGTQWTIVPSWWLGCSSRAPTRVPLRWHLCAFVN